MSTAAALATDRPLSFGLVGNQKNPLSGPLVPTTAGGGTPPLRVPIGLAGGIGRRGSAVIRVSGEVLNARVIPQRLCPLDDTEETADRNDMAHGTRYGSDEKGDGLRPAREVALHEKKPRRYHTSSMCGPMHRRISAESAIEESEERRRRLLVELGEIEGITTAYECSTVGASLSMFPANATGETMRNVLEPETKQREK